MSVELEAHPTRCVYVDGVRAGTFHYLEGSKCFTFTQRSDTMLKQQDLSDILDLLIAENSKL